MLIKIFNWFLDVRFSIELSIIDGWVSWSPPLTFIFTKEYLQFILCPLGMLLSSNYRRRWFQVHICVEPEGEHQGSSWFSLGSWGSGWDLKTTRRAMRIFLSWQYRRRLSQCQRGRKIQLWSLLSQILSLH